MKKRMFLMVFGVSMALAMTGCGKGQISTETELQDVEAPAAEEETEPVAEEVEEEPEIAEEKPEAPFVDGVLSIQTLFEYKRDGEAHMMHYYQDMTTDYSGKWRCVSRPDLGVESVPLKGDDLTDPNIQTMSYEEFSILENYDPNGHEIIDLSDIENIPDNTFIHWMLSDGLVGIFEQEIDYDGDLPTVDEVSLALNRYGVFPEEQVCEDVNEDGDTVYSGYCNFEYNEYFQYNGAYCFRVKDGKAQGAFSMYRDDADRGNVIGILPYMVQGIRFVQ